MKDEQPTGYPKELVAAMEDIREIRGVFDRMRSNHPFRLVLRPYFRFTLWMVPVIVVFGIISQQVYSTKASTVLGLSRQSLLWLMMLAMIVVSGVLKVSVFLYTAKETKLKASAFFTRFFIEDQYYRTYFSMVGVTAAASVALWQAGHPEQIVGMITAGAGGVLFLVPLSIPAPEFTKPGVFALITGIVAMFVLPDFPYYKVSVLWGGLCLYLGWFGMQTPFQKDSASDDSSGEVS